MFECIVDDSRAPGYGSPPTNRVGYQAAVVVSTRRLHAKELDQHGRRSGLLPSTWVLKKLLANGWHDFPSTRLSTLLSLGGALYLCR